MPLWGTSDRGSEAAVLASPYAGVYRLARRLTADADTPYDAVRAIERHLREGYDYSPNVPERTYPLAAFLFEDESGYCQQFAGTMALMLRMVGLPSRVVSGFAPGSLDEERDVYEVRDTDAHSWVEVYFRGIGWVTFDPTPAAAPAASQTLNAQLGTFFRGRGSVPEQGRGRARSLERALEGGTLGPVDDGGGPWRAIGLALLGVGAIAAAVAAIVFTRRRRALASGRLADAQVEEFHRALARLGWSVPDAPTLLGLERRFANAGRPAVAGYAAGLRAHRYAPDAPAPPGPTARRALRRALSKQGGLRRRLRACWRSRPAARGDRGGRVRSHRDRTGALALDGRAPGVAAGRGARQPGGLGPGGRLDPLALGGARGLHRRAAAGRPRGLLALGGRARRGRPIGCAR